MREAYRRSIKWLKERRFNYDCLNYKTQALGFCLGFVSHSSVDFKLAKEPTASAGCNSVSISVINRKLYNKNIGKNLI